jgi:uncharacterized membrane protein
MERMVVTIFDDEHKAYQGADVLQAVNEDGTVAVHEAWVLAKDRDGSVSVVKTEDTLPEGTMGGTVVGGLLGLLGGPVGVAIGATSGMALGATADVARARLGRDFITDVSRALAPGKIALVAEVDEESTDLLDERMKALDGQIFRRDLQDFADADYEDRATAVKSRLAQTRDEIAADAASGTQRLRTSLSALLGRSPDKRKS